MHLTFNADIIEIVYFELESVSWSKNEYNTTPLGCHVTPITENDTSWTSNKIMNFTRSRKGY